MNGEEHYNEDAPKCPYCDTEYGDAWELGMNDSDYLILECPNCEKEYEVSCCVSVTYTSNVVEPIENKIERARKRGYNIPDGVKVGDIVMYRNNEYKIEQLGPYLKMKSINGYVSVEM